LAFEQEQGEALNLLDGIEQGSRSAQDSFYLIKDADPTLIYFIFTWLRERYGADHPAAEGVVGRVVEICTRYPAVTRMVKRGEDDAVVKWFEESFSYRKLTADEFINIIVEKLEG